MSIQFINPSDPDSSSEEEQQRPRRKRIPRHHAVPVPTATVMSIEPGNTFNR